MPPNPIEAALGGRGCSMHACFVTACTHTSLYQDFIENPYSSRMGCAVCLRVCAKYRERIDMGSCSFVGNSKCRRYRLLQVYSLNASPRPKFENLLHDSCPNHDLTMRECLGVFQSVKQFVWLNFVVVVLMTNTIPDILLWVVLDCQSLLFLLCFVVCRLGNVRLRVQRGEAVVESGSCGFDWSGLDEFPGRQMQTNQQSEVQHTQIMLLALHTKHQQQMCDEWKYRSGFTASLVLHWYP